MLKRILCLIIVLAFLPSLRLQGQELMKPVDHFGFKPGSDRNLFSYEALIAYLKTLDNESERIKMVNIGTSPLGKPIYICFISAENNIARLESLRNINETLALIDSLNQSEVDHLVQEGRVFILATLSMHSGEVGPSQSAPIIAHHLAKTTNSDTLNWLQNTVFMMVPCHNPDGMNMIVDHYNRYKNTPQEGASMPGIYHQYVGHDNNRDFVTLSQSDTRAIARIYNLDWFPQVMVEKHQMGSTGPRYYVPPPHDPIAENIDARLWNWIGVFGANLQRDMTANGHRGIAQHYLFDDYWPGSTETCIWKNVIGFLTEAASAQYATPIYIEPTELKVYGKGLSEYKKSINMPLLWNGGWWRLSDIVDYEISSTYSIIKTASRHREKILRFQNMLCKAEVEKGRNEPPFYYIFPGTQHDQTEFIHLLELLLEHGLRLFKLEQDILIEKQRFEAGDVVVPLAQPFRAFVKEVLESQTFPLRHYTPDGEIVKPYDITSWSLPLHRGVQVYEIKTRVTGLEQALSQLSTPPGISYEIPEEADQVVASVNHNGSYEALFKALNRNITVYRLSESHETEGESLPKGSFVFKAKNSELQNLFQSRDLPIVFTKEFEPDQLKRVDLPKIGLIETYFHDMDAGWTRFVFDQYNIPYSVLRPAEVAKKELGTFDVLVFPDVSESILVEGKRKSGDQYYISHYPREYTKGMGKEGLEKLTEFMIGGGHIIAWGASTALFDQTLSVRHSKNDVEEFRLPFKNISADLVKKGLYVPGSFIQVTLVQNHPLTYGMPAESGIFFRGKPVFSTSIPAKDMDRRVIATFPDENLLLSGYSEQEKLLDNKAALVWLKKGKGQLTLFAFRPQFRASTQSTYKLLFNALLLEKLEE